MECLAIVGGLMGAANSYCYLCDRVYRQEGQLGVKHDQTLEVATIVCCHKSVSNIDHLRESRLGSECIEIRNLEWWA